MKKTAILFAVAGMLAFSGACSNSKGNTGNDKVTANENTSKGPIHITRAEFLTKVIDYVKNPTDPKYLGDKPCIVDFYATWCGPCKMVSPIMEDLAKEYAGQIYIYKVDTDKEPQLSGELGIQSIPTFIFCPVGGKPFGSAGTAGSPEETKAMFKKIIDEQLLKKQAKL